MSKYFLGLDVGGTKIQAGLINSKYKIVKSAQFPSESRSNKKTVLKNILMAIDSLHSKQVKAIGVGITGQVDPISGVAAGSSNLPHDWHNVPLKKIISNKFGVSCKIDNDVNCIALADAIIGKGKNYGHVFSLAIGTGIGVGFVINKKLYRGAHNVFEFGHTFISNESLACSCQQTGHLESFVSGPAMTKIYKRLTGQIEDPHTIEAKAKKGNKHAKKTFTIMSFYLGAGIANIAHTLNPDIIILGGGISKVKIITAPAIVQAKKRYITPWLNKTKIVTSNLGYGAGIIGASMLTDPRYK